MKELRAPSNLCGYLNGGLLLGYSRFLVSSAEVKNALSCSLFTICLNGVMQGAYLPIPVAALFKAWVCGRSLAGIVGSNPAGGMNVLSVVLCCQVEVCASD